MNTGALGSSVDVPFCAEAFAGAIRDTPLDVRVRRLDRDPPRSGGDASSAREWLERIEHRDGFHGVGAYTVLRSDALYDEHTCDWQMWGLDFHQSRLRSSYNMLSGGRRGADGCIFEASARETNDVIAALLDEASKWLLTDAAATKNHTKDRFEGEDAARTLMVTLLWTPPKVEGKPVVRGHAAFAGPACAPRNHDDALPAPVSACLAIPREPTPEGLLRVPHRHSDSGNSVGASAKLSSWCRARRPLEDPARFKVPGSGVGEVLLVRQDDDGRGTDPADFVNSLQILEGLTSNFFVIYTDGTVRTALAGDVLSGYARQLVAEALTEAQFGELTLDATRGPTVQDARDGLWAEAFVTSAVRLVVPVTRVLLPLSGDGAPSILWRAGDEGGGPPWTQVLRAAVRKRGRASATRRSWP